MHHEIHDAYTIHTPNQICMRIMVNSEWHMNYNSMRNDVRNMPTILIILFFFFLLILLCGWSAHLIWFPNSHHPISQLPILSSRLRIKIRKFIPMMKLKDFLILSFRFILSLSYLEFFYFKKCLLSSKFSSSSSSFPPCFCPKLILLSISLSFFFYK